MKNLGKVFKELRESRKISLRKATGGRFSASLLSRFENGQSEISAQKLFVALENIHANVEELLFLARGFHQDAYSEFRNRIVEAIDPQDLTSLRTIYQREYQQLPFSKDKQQHILNAILIKSYMKAIDETVTLTSEEERVLHDYLFSVEIWGHYELLFFSSCSPLLSVQLFTKYSREMLRKSDFLQGVGKNRNMMHTLLINALGGALGGIYNIFLLNHSLLDFSYKDALFILQLITLLAVIISSLTGNDYFGKQSLPRLMMWVTLGASLVGLSNLLNQVLLGMLFVFFTMYVSGKISPKISALLMKNLAPEVLSRTSNFLGLLFTLSIPVGTACFSLVAVWNIQLTWALFVGLSLLAILLASLNLKNEI